MYKLSQLKFISVEGNWDQSIHDARLSMAANIISEDHKCYAIASGTRPPAQYSSFTKTSLGEYTSKRLIEKANSTSVRIFPAYLIPHEFTYTILDAYTNSIIIGWLASGLKTRSSSIKVVLIPVTSKFHTQRVLAINKKAVECLSLFGLNVEVESAFPPDSNDIYSSCPEENKKISKMREKDGILSTGTWIDGERQRSFGDIEIMRKDLLAAISSTFGTRIGHKQIFCLSDIERVILTVSWLFHANRTGQEKISFDLIYTEVVKRFDDSINISNLKYFSDKLVSKEILHPEELGID